MPYNINGLLGVKVDADPVTTAAFTVGARALQSDGTEWIYAKASATIAAFDTVALLNDGTCSPITQTLALRGGTIAFAQQAYTADQFGWFLVANPTPPNTSGAVPASSDVYKVRVAASCAVDAKLATTATAGVLDDTTAGSTTRIDGIVLTDTNTASTTSARTFRTAFGGVHVENV